MAALERVDMLKPMLPPAWLCAIALGAASLGFAGSAAWGALQPQVVAGSVAAGGDVAATPFVDARQFGVRCDGRTDDTATLNALLAREAGHRIVLPAGTCRYSGGGVLRDGTVLAGNGRNATLVSVTAAAPAQVLTVSGYGAGVQDLGMIAAVPQTGGSWIALSGTESWLSDFQIAGDFNGIHLTGVGARVSHGRMIRGAAGATRILVDGGDTSELIEGVLIGADEGAPLAGIRIRHAAALIISDTSVIGQATNLLIDPGADQVVASLAVSNSFFDNGERANVAIEPGKGGSVVRSRLTGVWAGSSHKSDGVAIDTSMGGQVMGLHFIDMHAVLNAGDGIRLAGKVSDVVIQGGVFAANRNGIAAESGRDIIVSAAMIGPFGGLAANRANGVAIAPGVTGYVISGSIVRGNARGQIDDRGVANAKRLTENLVE